MENDALTVGGLIELLSNYPPDLEVREFSLDLRDPRVQEVIERPLISVNMGPVQPGGATWERD